MQSLLLQQRIDDRPQRVTRSHTLMLGTSPGIQGIHDAQTLPFDTVTYLLRADAARKELNSSGIFFAVDKRPDDDTEGRLAVRKRTERLRHLVSAIASEFTLTTHTDLEGRGLDETLQQVMPRLDIENVELRRYTRMQTAQVLHMHKEALNDSANLVKFGWILSRRSDGTPVGGEANFDESLPKDISIHRVYTAPAFTVNSTNGKAPYLLNESDRSARVCIPEAHDGVDREIAKVESGISRVMHDTLRITSEIILGLRSRTDVCTAETTALPLTKPMKQRVTDESALADLREMLAASLHALLP